MISKKLLGLLDLAKAQILFSKKIKKVIIINKYSNFVFILCK